MAIYYVDPDNGNDANDGLSFTNRLRTIGNKFLQFNDQVRLIASRTPTANSNVSFTNGADSVTLSTAKTLTIFDCDSAWTPATNVTCSTTSTTYVGGTACSTITPASAFTTGKLAYKTVSLDLSGYEAFSFMVYVPSGLSGAWSLNLCSDASGNTVVWSQAINASVQASGRWISVYFDGTTSLGTIGSISLSTTTDPGTQALYIDNIIACRHKNHVDHLSHLSLIGKNTPAEPEWYPILSILGTNVSIRSSVNPYPNTQLTKFRGVTETTTAYTFLPLLCGVGSDWATQAHQVTGGWNRTDMSTQTGETWMSGKRVQTTIFSGYAGGWQGDGAGNTTPFTDRVLEKVGFCHMAGPLMFPGGGTDTALVCPIGIVDHISSSPIIASTSVGGDGWLHMQFINCYNGALGRGSSPSGFSNIQIDRLLNCVNTSTAVVSAGYSSDTRYLIGQMMGATVGVAHDANGTTYMPRPPDSNSGTFIPAGGTLTIVGCTFSDVTTTVQTTSGAIGSETYLLNCNGVTDANVSHLAGTIYLEYFSGGAQRAKRWLTSRASGTLDQDESTVNSGNGSVTSWKFTGNAGAVSATFPDRVLLARIPVNGGSLVTVTCYVKVSATTSHAGIGTDLADGKPGVGDQQVYGTSATTNWEQVTMTFTPTVRGMIPIYGYIYTDSGASSPLVYFDDIRYSQA
jgi:hypothetical protein